MHQDGGTHTTDQTRVVVNGDIEIVVSQGGRHIAIIDRAEGRTLGELEKVNVVDPPHSGGLGHFGLGSKFGFFSDCN